MKFSMRLWGLGLCSLLLWMGALNAHAITFRLDEAGYHPQGPKIVLLETVPEDVIQRKNFKVVLVSTDKKDLSFYQKEKNVHEAKILETYPESGALGPVTLKVLMDFSDFNRSGTYFFRIEGTDSVSQPVKITEFMYWDTLKPTVRAFFLQRCGQNIADPVTDIGFNACHSEDAKLSVPKSNQKGPAFKDVAGGWHDAADYSKHTTTTALAAARLLSMFEWGQKPFQYFSLEYPATEPFLGTVNDLLHEVRVGLDWLMVMQRPDGGFYSKVASRPDASKIEYPSEDLEPRHLAAVTTQDTAAAVAALAMASRSYKKKELGYAVKVLLAAERGWAYLENHPSPIAPTNSVTQAGHSHQYVLPAKAGSDLAYRLWAASELYLATRKPVYHQYFLAHYQKVPVELFTWKNPAMLALADYALYGESGRDVAADTYIRQKVLSMADTLAHRIERNPYGVAVKHFAEGSNAEITEGAALLMVAYRLTGEEAYRNAATRTVRYLFGFNPMGKTFITSLTPSAVTRPHHYLSISQKRPVPGLMVNGPNAEPTDGTTPPARGMRSYADNAMAASSNEPGIFYNASLAFVLGALNAAYNL